MVVHHPVDLAEAAALRDSDSALHCNVLAGTRLVVSNDIRPCSPTLSASVPRLAVGTRWWGCPSPPLELKGPSEEQTILESRLEDNLPEAADSAIIGDAQKLNPLLASIASNPAPALPPEPAATGAIAIASHGSPVTNGIAPVVMVDSPLRGDTTAWGPSSTRVSMQTTRKDRSTSRVSSAVTLGGGTSSNKGKIDPGNNCWCAPYEDATRPIVGDYLICFDSRQERDAAARGILAQTVLACSSPCSAMHGLMPSLWAHLGACGVPCPGVPRFTLERCPAAVGAWGFSHSEDTEVPELTHVYAIASSARGRSVQSSPDQSALAELAYHGIVLDGVSLDAISKTKTGCGAAIKAGCFGAVLPGHLSPARSGTASSGLGISRNGQEVVVKVAQLGASSLSHQALIAGLLACESISSEAKAVLEQIDPGRAKAGAAARASKPIVGLQDTSVALAEIIALERARCFGMIETSNTQALSEECEVTCQWGLRDKAGAPSTGSHERISTAFSVRGVPALLGVSEGLDCCGIVLSRIQG